DDPVSRFAGPGSEPVAERLDHARHMGRLPVDLAAARAAAEAPPGPEDIGRHAAAYLVPRHGAGPPVALDAAPEKVIFPHAEPALFEDLADLLAQVLAGDQDVVPGGPPLDQPAVPRQDGALLPHGEGDQIGVLDAREVGHVVA